MRVRIDTGEGGGGGGERRRGSGCKRTEINVDRSLPNHFAGPTILPLAPREAQHHWGERNDVMASLRTTRGLLRRHIADTAPLVNINVWSVGRAILKTNASGFGVSGRSILSMNFFFFLQWHFVISWKFKLSQINQNWPASKWTRIKFFTLGNSVISLDTLMTRSRKTSQDGGFTVKQGKKTLYTRSLSKVWTPSGWKSKQSARDFSWTGHLNRQQPHYKRSHSHIN